jgi:hypothetical protein
VNGHEEMVESLFCIGDFSSFLLSFGCAGISKDAKIKCPKCGAIFTVDEGLNEIQQKGY